MTLRLAGPVAFALFALQAQAPPPPPQSPSPFMIAAERAKAVSYPGAGRPIALKFDWPDGLTATIEVDRSKIAVTPEGRRTQRAAMRYRMRVRPHKNGRLIEYDRFEPLSIQLAGAEQAAFVEMLSSMMPSIVVADSGEFVRIADMTAIRTTMRQFMDGLRKQAPDKTIPPGLQEMLDNLTSDDVLTRLAAAEWELMVGSLVGFKGTIGEMTSYDAEEPSPVMPTLMVPMRTTFGALRAAPCAFGREEDSCVDMQVKSVVAPGGMQVVMKRLLEGMKGLEGLTYERFDVTNTVVTTLEPSTMRPHRVEQTKRADFTMAMPGRGRADASMTERRTLRITYQQH